MVGGVMKNIVTVVLSLMVFITPRVESFYPVIFYAIRRAYYLAQTFTAYCCFVSILLFQQ